MEQQQYKVWEKLRSGKPKKGRKGEKRKGKAEIDQQTLSVAR